MSRKNVFFVGLDDFNRETLAMLPHAAACDFHAALTIEEIRDVDTYDIDRLVETAAKRMADCPGGAHGVASFFDFPGTIIAAILAQRFGLPGPSLESLLKLEHKYWSRLEQQKVVPDHIPAFRAFDPFDEEAFGKLELIPPFWVKPIKSFRSYLAFHIQSERQFRDVMQVCREKGGQLTDPFRHIMDEYNMPHELADMPETFIAESPIGGAQCTLEGYVHNGQVVVYGVVDSVREPDGHSFSRYEYPSFLPLEIQHRMIDVARSAVTQVGYDNAPFNVEFFYDQTAQHVWLLEVNPRASQSHADLFQKVHGTPHLSVIVDLALGRKPKPMDRRGKWNVAAHLFLRHFGEGKVVRIPTERALTHLRKRQPDTRVKIEVDKNQNLADLKNQDSYSYEIAHLYIGGRDRADILDKYDEALAMLQFEIEPETHELRPNESAPLTDAETGAG
jgi:hypothetical protein